MLCLDFTTLETFLKPQLQRQLEPLVSQPYQTTQHRLQIISQIYVYLGYK
jgi:hypothetical protein